MPEMVAFSVFAEVSLLKSVFLNKLLFTTAYKGT